jgi:Ca2+-binding RTX toxin-like protein
LRQSYKVQIFNLKPIQNTTPEFAKFELAWRKTHMERKYEASGVFIEVLKSVDSGLAITKALNNLNKNNLTEAQTEIAKIELASALLQGGATALNLTSGIMKTLVQFEDSFPYIFKSKIRTKGFSQVAESASLGGGIFNLGASVATIAILANSIKYAKTDNERNYYIAELSVQAGAFLVSTAQIGYALKQFATAAKYSSSVAKGFGAVTAVFTLSATIFEIVNLSAEFNNVTKTRNELFIYERRYGFAGFNVLVNSLERTAIANASFLAGQSTLAVIGIAGSFVPVVGIAISIIAGIGSIILASIQQSVIEALIDRDIASLLNSYGSWSNYWATSYAALRRRYEDTDAFKAMIKEYQSMINDDEYGRVVLLSSMTPNDIQFQIAGRLRAGASLQNQEFDATIVSKQGLTRNQYLINSSSASIDITISYLRQYVSFGPTLISPSEINAVRNGSGKNSYTTSIIYTPRIWNVVDGNTFSTVDLRGLAMLDDGRNSSNAATFDMGGGNDVLLMGVRKVTGDLGSGFNGIDYSNISLNLNVVFGEDGWVSINKKGDSEILIEFIDSRTTSVGKRTETVQFLNTQYVNRNIDTNDWIKNVSYIKGTSGDDIFKGNSKQNYFIASKGNDVYDGGGGGDWIDYSQIQGSVKLALNVQLAHAYNLFKELTSAASGITSLTVSTGGMSANFSQILNNIQNVRGSLGMDILVGDQQDNILDGSGGDDKLYGLSGNDTFIASSSGNSFYDGGFGSNFLDYGTISSGANERISVSISLGHDGTVVKSSDNKLSSTDSFSLIHGIRGTDGNDTFMGGELDDQFFGQGGNDVFDTMAGDDIVVTGLGKDTVNLGFGNDKAYVQHNFASSAGVPLQTDTADSVIGKGRYVYIRKNNGVNSYLVLAELQVISNKLNVAQGKSTDLKYSGQYDDKTYSALHLVDGKTNGNNDSDGIFLSNQSDGGWIQVDLGASTSIDAINIFGRNSWGSHNGNYTVYISDSDMSGKTDSELKAMSNIGYYQLTRADSSLAITSKLTTTSGSSANFFKRDLNTGEKVIDGGKAKTQ